MRRFLGLATLLCLTCTPSFGSELPHFFEGVRPLGMGGAFTAVSDDENALFYNPAGLDRVKSWGMAVLNPLVEVGNDGTSFARDAMGTDLDDAGEVVDLLRDYIGKTEHYRAALFPHFLMRHFAVGVLAQSNTTLQANNVAFPESEVQGLQTVSGHVGAGFGFFDDILRLGVGLKYVYAYSLDEVYTAFEIADDDFKDRVEDDLEDGGGFGVDAGLMVEFPVFLRPTLAASILNIADTDLGNAGELPQQINLGLAMTQEFPWIDLTAAADWIDVTGNLGDDDDTFKRIHLGLEGRFTKVVSLRIGLYQGYGALGATLDFRAFKLDYATYAEELGSDAGDRGDRRHVLQASLGW